jgi:hypothetical protein
MKISVGCSGWSYDDWVGAFYPMELANKKGEWFDYYARYFQTVEINSTFYRPSTLSMVLTLLYLIFLHSLEVYKSQHYIHRHQLYGDPITHVNALSSALQHSFHRNVQQPDPCALLG